MKAIFNPNDTLTNKISLYHLVLFVVALPYQFYSELVLVSFLLHTIISLKKKHVKNLFRKEVLLLVSVFLITLVCTLYTPNKKEAFNLLSRQLAILIFPVLLLLNPIDLKKYTKTILLAFVFSCTIAITYLYADAIRAILYFHLPLSTLFSPAFMNHNFSNPIGIHATYLSLYLALSIAVCICYFLIEHRILLKFIWVLSACLLGLGLLQLGSRSVLIALLLFLCLVVPFFLKLKRFYIAGVSLFTITLVSFVATTPSLKTRYFTLLEEDLSEKTADYSIADPRMKRWQVAFELVKNSPLIGYGSSNEVNLLKEQYFQNKLYNS
jgi:O-antigen ligase